ncbi:hypothetical protein Clacol_006949 [Clathrus columnatus]|uniref:Uncharacterized protein n=1 Tax=Clathrus columnatus TaxID=1419009 RepID=A0AAV5AEN8_9AGAM|nr:hypothetical protein Clacol_006949 [Clathrus columnatus]
MQTYAETFFATPGNPIIPPPGSNFASLTNLLVTSDAKSKFLPPANLRAYLHAAKVVRPKLMKGLPPVCQTPHERITPSDAFLLSMEPDSRCRLKKMALLDEGKINQTIITFLNLNRTVMDKFVPSKPIEDTEDPATRIRTPNFNIPAPGFLVYFKPLPSIDNVMTLAKHTLQLLETSERVLNLVWPKESGGYTFTIPTESSVIPAPDSEICVPIYYTKVSEGDLIRMDEAMIKMVVLVVPPWAFADADLYEFINMSSFPDFKMKEDGTCPTYTRAQKLWAQVYDCCAAKNCPFFAITTFANWVFGAFNPSSGWSNVFCTPLIGHADFNPSILEWVTYWVASSLKVPGTFSLSQSPNSGVPEIGNASNLELRSANDQPTPTLSGQEWLDRYLGGPHVRPDDIVTKTTFNEMKIQLKNDKVYVSSEILVSKRMMMMGEGVGVGVTEMVKNWTKLGSVFKVFGIPTSSMPIYIETECLLPEPK